MLGCGVRATTNTKGPDTVHFLAFLLGGPIGIRTRVMVTITSSRVLTESCATRPVPKKGTTRTRWQSRHAKYCYSAFESDVAPRLGLELLASWLDVIKQLRLVVALLWGDHPASFGADCRGVQSVQGAFPLTIRPAATC